MQNLSLLQSILLFAVPAVMAITVHEAAHGFTARHFGDRTAEVLGRLTFNPLKHIDPIGTVAVPLGLLVMSKMTGAPLLILAGPNRFLSVSAICVTRNGIWPS